MLTFGDKFLIGVLLVTSVLSLLIYRGLKPRGVCAVVEARGVEVHRLDLSMNREVHITGPLGETVVEVRGGRVRVKRSPCPHKICVHTGFKDANGDVIACIPNRIVVRIEGGERGWKVDGVTR